jgi:hypothetical protein
LEDPEIVKVLESMPKLAVLNLMANPVIQKIKNYRRVLVSRLKNLTYLDDRPVFEKERLAVEAWARGGMEAEREERERQKQEEIDGQKRNYEAMKKMQEEARQKRLQEYGPDEEPVFPEKLQGLYNSMMAKIEEIDDTQVTKDEEVPPGEPISSENAVINAEEYEDAPVRPRAHISTSGISFSEPDESKSICKEFQGQKIQEIEEEPMESVYETPAAEEIKTMESISESMVTLVDQVQATVSEKAGSCLPNDDLLQEKFDEKSSETAPTKAKSTVKVTRELLKKIHSNDKEEFE